MKINLSQTRLALVVATLAAGSSVYAEHGGRFFSRRELQEGAEYDPEIVGYSANSEEIAFGGEADLDVTDEIEYTDRSAPLAEDGGAPVDALVTTVDGEVEQVSAPEVIPENESGTESVVSEVDVEDIVLDMIQNNEPIETGSSSKSDIRERAEAAYQSLLASLRSEASDTLSPQARSNNGASDQKNPPTQSPTSTPTLSPSLPPVPMEKAHPFGGFDDKALNGEYGMLPQGRSNGGEATDTTIPRPAAKDAKTTPQRPVPKTASTSSPPPRPPAKNAATSAGAAAKDNGFGRGSGGVAKSTTSTTTAPPPGESVVATGRFGSNPPPVNADVEEGPNPEPRSANTGNEGMDENADSDATTITDSPEQIPLSPLGARLKRGGPRGARPRGGTFGAARSNPAPKQITPAPKQPNTAQEQQQPQQQPQPANIQTVAAAKQGDVQEAAKKAYKKVKKGNTRKLGRFS